MEVLWRHHAEPTLCFDGDRAGRLAASRAIDRALPHLQPGKSFRFALVTGGKDPDDVLREHGPQALRQQLSETTPFVDMLFRREQELEPLDTPERRAGLKGRLRLAAGSISDKDLAQAYREAFFSRLDALFAPARAAAASGAPRTPRAGRGGWRNAAPDLSALPATPQAQAAAKRLSTALDPLAAALCRFAILHPSAFDDYLEDDFTAKGFGEPALRALSRQIIDLKLQIDHLDSDHLTRHLAACGFSVLLTDIDRAAATSGAPFLKEDVSLEDAKSQWSQAFAALSRAAALDEAVGSAKGNLRGRSDMESLERLKGERDALKRAIRTGTIWMAEGS